MTLSLIPSLLSLELQVVLWCPLLLGHHVSEPKHGSTWELEGVIDPNVPKPKSHLHSFIVILLDVGELEIIVLTVKLRHCIYFVKTSSLLPRLLQRVLLPKLVHRVLLLIASKQAAACVLLPPEPLRLIWLLAKWY